MTPPDSKRFTLIEILIVVAACSVLAAIAIPGPSSAGDRGKQTLNTAALRPIVAAVESYSSDLSNQKLTMASMRAIGAAIESYAVDHNVYPVAATTTVLSGLIAPVYIKTMPAADGWNNNFTVTSVAVDYTLSSLGKDGASQGCVAGRLTTLFTQDICFANGQFVQYPQGPQH